MLDEFINDIDSIVCENASYYLLRADVSVSGDCPTINMSFSISRSGNDAKQFIGRRELWDGIRSKILKNKDMIVRIYVESKCKVKKSSTEDECEYGALCIIDYDRDENKSYRLPVPLNRMSTPFILSDDMGETKIYIPVDLEINITFDSSVDVIKKMFI